MKFGIRYSGVLVLFIALFLACKQDQVQQISSGDAALDMLNLQVEDNPRDHTLLYQRAQLLAEKESYAEAISDLQRAISIDSVQASYFHALSDVYMDYYKSRAALNIMEQAVERFPTRIATLLKLSETQLILKDYSSSIRTVNNILSIESQNAEAYFMLGLNFAEQGDTTRAINAFHTAVENEPELIDAWLYIGSLYEDQDIAKALQYYDAAIESNPLSIEAIHHKAFLLQNNNRIDEAIQEYTKINEIDIHYTAAYLNKGILYFELDSLERAFEEFNILVGLDPQYANAYFYRGLSHQMLGRLSAARNDYKSAITLDPEMEKAQRALGDLPKE